MEKINLPFFCDLGFHLRKLTETNLETATRMDVLVDAIVLRSDVNTLLVSYPSLSVCRNAASELTKEIETVSKWFGTIPQEIWQEETSKKPDYQFHNVVNKAKELNTILSAELQGLATYHVDQKGIYSTSHLVESAENAFPSSIKEKLTADVEEEFRQSGRCLAFDNSTASGFHAMRAVEATMHQYYIAVCKPKPKKKLENWGAYIAKLHKINQPNVKFPDVAKVVAMLQQLKDQDRNLIMHPEVVLTSDEAFTLFETAQSIIMSMATRLPKAKQPAKNQVQVT